MKQTGRERKSVAPERNKREWDVPAVIRLEIEKDTESGTGPIPDGPTES